MWKMNKILPERDRWGVEIKDCCAGGWKVFNDAMAEVGWKTNARQCQVESGSVTRRMERMKCDGSRFKKGVEKIETTKQHRRILPVLQGQRRADLAGVSLSWPGVWCEPD